MQDNFIKMNGAVLVALVASALVGVSTANPVCQKPEAQGVIDLVPGIARQCGNCECADALAEVRQLFRGYLFN